MMIWIMKPEECNLWGLYSSFISNAIRIFSLFLARGEVVKRNGNKFPNAANMLKMVRVSNILKRVGTSSFLR